MARPKKIYKDKVKFLKYGEFFKQYSSVICNYSNSYNVKLLMYLYDIDYNKAKKIYDKWKNEYIKSSII